MNMRELAIEIARREGGRKSVSIAQIKEIVGIISDLIYESAVVDWKLHENGKRRAKRKKK